VQRGGGAGRSGGRGERAPAGAGAGVGRQAQGQLSVRGSQCGRPKLAEQPSPAMIQTSTWPLSPSSSTLRLGAMGARAARAGSDPAIPASARAMRLETTTLSPSDAAAGARERPRSGLPAAHSPHRPTLHTPSPPRDATSALADARKALNSRTPAGRPDREGSAVARAEMRAPSDHPRSTHLPAAASSDPWCAPARCVERSRLELW
jgi:hypothetical protein